MATEDDSTPALTRRQALRAAAGACGLLALGTVFAAVPAAEATTGIRRLSNGKVQVDLSKVSGLNAPGKAILLGVVRGVTVGLVRTKNSYVALNLRCPHAGQPVNWTGSSWSCPAHFSAFAAGGALTRGPAMTGLARVPLVRSGQRLTIG